MAIVLPDLFALLLVLQLGSPLCRDREIATRHLAFLGVPVRPYLLFGQEHPDAEIASRSRRLVQELYAVPVPRSTGNIPWIDALPLDFPERRVIIDKYLAKAHQEIGWNQTDWLDWRHATWLFAREWLRAGKCKNELRAILCAMAYKELRYRLTGIAYWNQGLVRIGDNDCS